MHARLIALAWLAAAAFGQTVEQALPLVNVNTHVGIQELTLLVRSIGDIRDVSYDGDRRAIVIQATHEQIALAQWLVLQLDKQPPAPQGFAAYEYHPPAGPDVLNTAVRVFYLAHATRPTEINEISQILPSSVGIARTMPLSLLPALVLRGSPQQAALAEWLVQQLDQPVQPGRKTAAFEYQSPPGDRDVSATAVRIVYLANTPTPAGMQEIQQVMRAVADVDRAFPIYSRKAMVLHARPERIALAEWLIAQVDQPPQPGRKPASYTYQSPDPVPSALASVARVYYLTHAAAPTAVQSLMSEIRGSANVNRMYYCSASQALAFRGTVDQVALTERLIAAADR